MAVDSIFDLEKLHKLELKIALEIKRVCEKNNIRYFLAYGTLLGAVRHGGFIPWDDDFDIAMPREEYEKFVEIFPQKTNPDVFFMENWDTEEEYGLTFTKIKLQGTVFEENSIKNTNTHKGIFVDVFPYDGLPDDVKRIKKTARKIVALGKMYKFRLGYGPTDANKKNQKWQAKIIGILCKPLRKSKLKDRLYREEIKYNKENPKYVTVISGANHCSDYFNKEYLNESIKIKFMDQEFNAPKEYDKVLKSIYGDYMKLPPEEERVFRHNLQRIDFGKY